MSWLCEQGLVEVEGWVGMLWESEGRVRRLCESEDAGPLELALWIGLMEEGVDVCVANVRASWHIKDLDRFHKS